MSDSNGAWFASLDQVVRNLNAAIKKIENQTLEGMIVAVAELRYDMDKTPPLIPVDTGNLRSSWTTIVGYDSKNNPFITCGFNANYARWVHDNIGATFKRPMSGALFFTAAINRNRKKILQTIATYARPK